MTEKAKENTKARKIRKLNLSEEQRKAFIDEYGEDKLKIAELPLDELDTESIEVVLLVPDRRVTGMYLKFSDTDPKKAMEILVKNCLLTDKEIVMKDDALFNTAVSAIAELIPIRESKIKKF